VPAGPAGAGPFADLTLARRLERTEAHANAMYVEAAARAHPDAGACWIEVAGAYGMFDGPTSPVTQSFGLGLFAEPSDAELERLERFFAERAADTHHEVSPLAGVALAARLADRGYRVEELSNVVYRPIGPGTPPIHAPDPAIRVRTLRRDEAALWADLTVRGWSHHPEFLDYLRANALIAADRQDGLSCIAELDGEPVAAGGLAWHAGVALLAGACTVPEARRRGAQLALLHYRLEAAVAQGCDLAMMAALPGSGSQRNAERHGFRVAYTRFKWFRRREVG